MEHQLTVAGITPMSTVDYPNLLSSVIYTQGCPLRCGYCHNPHLISTKASSDYLTWDYVLGFLEQRLGFLQGVVFSGGEPTLQPGLLIAIDQVKKLGFKIGLHTSGVYPTKLTKLLPYIDWIGLDVKALPQNYDQVCGRPNMSLKVDESINKILESPVDFEVRVTIHPLDIDTDGVVSLIERMSRFGVSNLAIQVARGGQTLEPSYSRINDPFNMKELDSIVKRYSEKFDNLWIRNN